MGRGQGHRRSSGTRRGGRPRRRRRRTCTRTSRCGHRSRRAADPCRRARSSGAARASGHASWTRRFATRVRRRSVDSGKDSFGALACPVPEGTHVPLPIGAAHASSPTPHRAPLRRRAHGRRPPQRVLRHGRQPGLRRRRQHGATYANDFVELFNRVRVPSISRRGRSGTPRRRHELAGHATDRHRSAGRTSSFSSPPRLPSAPRSTPDATGTTNLANSGGKVAVVRSTTAVVRCHGRKLLGERERRRPGRLRLGDRLRRLGRSTRAQQHDG